MRPLLRNDESAYGAVQLATSADYYFGADSIALRATFRFGAVIADTARMPSDVTRHVHTVSRFSAA